MRVFRRRLGFKNQLRLILLRACSWRETLALARHELPWQPYNSMRSFAVFGYLVLRSSVKG
jgi:hypothetical protein